MEHLNKKIFVFDNVLSKKECNELIAIYNSRGPTHQWQSFFPMTISSKDDLIMGFVNKILDSLKSLVVSSINVDWCEIVKWPENSFMNPHKDFSKQETIFTSITYLNTNYIGGHTYFVNDIEFIPKIGRTIFFDGQYHEHGVSKIITGTRFTLPIWYKT